MNSNSRAWRYIRAAGWILLGTPLGSMIAWGHFPTPGIYVFRLFPVTDIENEFVALRFVLCGLVNSACCYFLVHAAIATVDRFRKGKNNSV
jgi:hypothetical protein